MARRPKGDGTYRLRQDGRWEARLTLANGKRRSFFGKTQAEAGRRMREAQAKLDGNLPIPNARLTVEGHLKDWLAEKKKTVRPETYRRYDDYCRLYLIPELGRTRLVKLDIGHVRGLHESLAGRLSGTTCHHIHTTLHAALQDALRWGRVLRNVASLVSAPKRSTGEMKFLRPEDAQVLLLAAKGESLEALYMVALTAGLREGELQALRRKDVDLSRRRLTVTATLITIDDGEPVFGEPKTQHSKRTIYLSEMAADALERHLNDQDAKRRLACDAWKERGLVFCNDLGGPLWRSQIRSAFKKLLEKAELPDMRVHDLRHSAATLLLHEGVPVKVVSEMLGHSDVATTLRIYAHIIQGAQTETASAMDRLFRG